MSTNTILTRAVAVFCLAGAGLAVGHAQLVPKSSAMLPPVRVGTYERHVCTGCGLQKSVEVSKFGAEAERTELSFHPTSVSRAIGTNGCEHSWLLYACGRIDGGDYILSDLPEGKRPTDSIYVLLSSPKFAGELAAMEKPHEKWRLLVTSLSTNRALDRSLNAWSTAAPQRSYTGWWQQSSLAQTNKP